MIESFQRIIEDPYRSGRRLLPYVLALLALALVVGIWWSGARTGLETRSRAIDLAWGEVESAYYLRAQGVVPLLTALAQDEMARAVPLDSRVRAELAAAYEAYQESGDVDTRVRRTNELERAARLFLRESAANTTLAASTPFRIFGSVYNSSESTLARPRQRYNNVVRTYNEYALSWPNRLVSGFGDPTRPTLLEP